jgi:hypothetical protein
MIELMVLTVYATAVTQHLFQAGCASCDVFTPLEKSQPKVRFDPG